MLQLNSKSSLCFCFTNDQVVIFQVYHSCTTCQRLEQHVYRRSNPPRWTDFTADDYQRYQFLSPWINCFTTTFFRGQSMNGEFTLDDLNMLMSTIGILNCPKPIAHLVHQMIWLCFLVTWNTSYALASHIWFQSIHHIWNNLYTLHSPLNVTNVLSSDYKLFFETHVYFITCYPRERLIIELFRKYDGLNVNEAYNWEEAISGAICSVT